MKSIVQCVQCYCHQMSLWCCESVIFCNLSGWLMYSVRWWGRERCNFVCDTKGIAAKVHSTPRPRRVTCNWLSSVRLRWMICTLMPYWCILIWMICTLLMHFLGGFRNCVTHAGRVWPSRQASHQVGRSTWTREVSYPTMANANLRIAQQCKGFKALVKLLFFFMWMCPINPLCVYLHCKVSIGQYTKMCTSPLIFFSSIISDDKYLRKIFDHFHFHCIFDHLSHEQS